MRVPLLLSFLLSFFMAWVAAEPGAAAPWESLAELAAKIETAAKAAGPETAAGFASESFDGAKLHPAKGVVSRVGIGVMKTADALDKALSPHKPFTRPLSRLDPRPLHLQAAQMEKDLRARFLVSDGKLFLFQKPMTLGDMTLWQGNYAAMSVLRWTWDERPESLASAEKAFDGLGMMYRPGYPITRGILPAGMEHLDKKDPRTKSDGRWEWQDDASVDQASGWLFGMILAEKYLPSRRGQARELLRRFADDLIANDFHIKNSDGSDTRFGNMGKGLVSPPPGVLMTITVLNAAAKNSDDPKYGDALEEFAAKRQDAWGSYASAPALWMTKDYNHNIGFLALASALLVEEDSGRWLRYARGMVRMARIAERTGNSFWLYLAQFSLQQRQEMAAFQQDDPEITGWLAQSAARSALAKKSMQEFVYPKERAAVETARTACRNSKKARWPLSGKETFEQPLPIWARPAEFVWQRSPYSSDHCDGAGQTPEYTGLDFLIAYYLGLHTQAVDPSE